MRIADYTAWSPYGRRTAALAEALRGDLAPPPRIRSFDLPAPGVMTVPDFDIATEVGPKGVRSMDRATALAVSTTGRLLGGIAVATDLARTALVLGTTTGSLGTMLDFSAHSLTRPKPYLVDPGKIPVTVMNYAAGQCAIRHRITGPNATVPAGRVAMALAMRHAQRLLDAGRVDQVLCGATEEATPHRAWTEWHARPGSAPAFPVGEGCVMLRLVPSGDEHGPRILAVATELAGIAGPAAALEDAVLRALDTAGVGPGDIWAVSGAGALDGHDQAENHALQAVFGRPGPRRIAAHPLVGDTSAATTGFELLTVLETARARRLGPGRAFALTTLDRSGLACCTVGRT